VIAAGKLTAGAREVGIHGINDVTSIAVTCVGMADYMARCIRRLIEDFDGHVEVVATRPNVPIEGMEQSLGQPVHWIDGQQEGVSWAGLGLARPDILLQGGYYLPSFRSLAKDVRAGGGKVVLGSDNNWQGTIRHRFVEPLRHALLLRNEFDGVMTTGRSGIRYSLAMGYPADRIALGLYGADPVLFNGGPPLAARPKIFLFVGQLIERKNVLGAARAFLRVACDHPDWMLQVCGSGPLRDAVARHPTIHMLGFVQPPQLAKMMRGARCLVLPSLEEHWGVVVHEAALSGCALALSSAVGAADDFAREDNAVLFPLGDDVAIERALREVLTWDDARWAQAEARSRELGAEFGPHRFSSQLRRLVSLLSGACTG
jgi:glycosyltransferase involved in cell wall biosynthesis